MIKTANDFLDSLKNNPDEIIAWCKKEIKLYEKLIEDMEKAKKSRTFSYRARTERARISK